LHAQELFSRLIFSIIKTSHLIKLKIIVKAKLTLRKRLV
jgi:hypothetical protein